MRNALALYVHYARASIRSQLQYRASAVMSAISTFLVSAGEVAAIWALLDRFGHVRGWTLPEIALFYGIVLSSWSIADAFGRGFDAFHGQVRDGSFDRLLVRPRSTALQLLGQELVLRRLGRLAMGTVLIGYAATAGSIDWTPARAVLVGAAIAGGVCTFLGLLVLQATSAFWTIESIEVWNAFSYGGLTASQYPLPIYRRWFRALFIFVFPLGCVNYFPGIAILGRPDPLGAPSYVGWIAPLAGPVFLALCLQIWRIGVRHYRSTGG